MIRLVLALISAILGYVLAKRKNRLNPGVWAFCAFFVPGITLIRQFEYWKVIDAAKVAREASPDKDKRFTSHALKRALENLAKERDLEGNSIRMRNIDLSGVNLEDGINLSGVDLSLSKFRSANLSGVDLSRTTLHRATFARARIFGTNFHFADLGSDQYKATFKQALYDESTIFPDNFDPDNVGAFKIAPGVSLIKASLVKTLLWDGNLERSDLDSADLERATLDGSNFQECNLQRANLRGVIARNANFQGANLCDTEPIFKALIFLMQFSVMLTSRV